MNTIAHMVIASAVLSRPDAPKRNWAVLSGALIPDASMYIFFAWSRLQGWTGDKTWNVEYWTEPWQTFGAVSNSFVLFGLLFAVAWWRNWPLWSAFAIAALVHIALDFPLHADDAHRHFWPISDWRFFSPVSYWDPAQNGLIGGVIESISALLALGVLWWRFKRPRWRALFMVLAALQLLAFGSQIAWTLAN